jgi:hypothetical protein
MRCQSYAPYRGFQIDVFVTTGKTLCLHNAGCRYKVSWTINSSDQSAEKVASFPERLEFMSERDAFKYAEKRAHTFIDCMLSRRSDSCFPGEEEAREEAARLM